MSRRVLVVDDSDHIRRLVAAHIHEAHGLQLCGEASDGAQGVASAAKLRPDVIILDQEMPVLDGLGALEKLRAALPGAVIVMFSSADDPTVRQRAMASGADAFFEKGPHDLAHLMTFLVE